MTIELACGELAYVDLTFAGLEALPGPGEERHATDFMRSAGGGAITAIGAARLGLATALVSPIGADPDGDFLRAALADEGVRWAGRTVARSAITAVMPVGGDRAMATYEPGEQVTAAELAAVAPRAVVLSLPRLGAAPPGALVYATVGDPDARAVAGSPSIPGLDGAHVLLINDHEACVLTGTGDPQLAARRLAEWTPRVVVTLGPDGAIELGEDGLVQARAFPYEAVDTTGAGDLFAAAYVWADLRGADPSERLRWAVLYSSLSVRVATAVGGAATLETLVRTGEGYGLAPPALHDSVAIEE